MFPNFSALMSRSLSNFFFVCLFVSVFKNQTTAADPALLKLLARSAFTVYQTLLFTISKSKIFYNNTINRKWEENNIRKEMEKVICRWKSKLC